MNVIVYSTPSCPYCNMAKEYFKEQDVDLTEYDVSKNREKAKEMINKSGQQGVPVIDIDGEIIVGFDKNKIDSLISE